MATDMAEFTMDELSEQRGTRLPARHLMQTVTLTVTVSVGVSGLPAVPGLPGLPGVPSVPLP
jgi:hypothetical protein